MRRSDYVEVGQRRVALTVKEIETEDELRGYNQLAQYHYRGKNLHGRRTPLILVCHDPLLPSVLGYVELSTAFLMNKPRATVLNAPWTDPESGIGWTGWSKDTVRQYTNLVVRIARTVVLTPGIPWARVGKSLGCDTLLLTPASTGTSEG